MNVLLSSLKWSYITEIGSKLIQPLSFLILAYFLTPESLGIVSGAMIVVAFSQVIWEAGFGKAIIQNDKTTIEQYSTLFWINFLLGLITSLLIFVFSERIAYSIFSDSRIILVLKYMSIFIVLSSLNTIQIGIFQKKFEFKKLLNARLSGSIVQAILSTSLAYLGYDYFSLVYGLIIGQIIQVVLIWKQSSWRPKLIFELNHSRPLIVFGFWTALSAMLSWFYMWMDNLVVASYLGFKELGLYRYGNMIPSLFFTMLFSPAIPVLYSFLSKSKRKINLLKQTMSFAFSSVVIISFPLALILFLNSNIIELILFNEEWEGIGFVISILTVMHAFSWIIGFNGEYYRAINRPKLDTIVSSSLLIFYFLGYIYFVQKGFETFIYGRLILAIIALIPHFITYLILSKSKINSFYFTFIQVTAFCICIYLLSFYFLFNFSFENLFFQILYNSVISLLILVLYYLIFKRKILIILRFLKK